MVVELDRGLKLWIAMRSYAADKVRRLWKWRQLSTLALTGAAGVFCGSGAERRWRTVNGAPLANMVYVLSCAAACSFGGVLRPTLRQRSCCAAVAVAAAMILCLLLLATLPLWLDSCWLPLEARWRLSGPCWCHQLGIQS